MVWAGPGDPRPYNPGFDFAEGVHKVAILRWDTQTLGWVKWQGASTAPDVAIANFPALTTVTGTVETTAPAITTVTYVYSPSFFLATTSIVSGSIGIASGSVGISGPVWATLSGVNFIIASPTGSQGISGNVGATQSGVWTVGITAVSQVAIASVNGNVGISGNIGATQSGVWAVGLTPGGQVAIASGNVGVSGSVVASLSGTNYVIASTTQVASYTYADVSASGNTTVVPSQGGVLRIVVHQCCVVASPSVLVCFLSSTSTVTSRKPVGGGTGFGGGFVLPYSPHGWFRTRAGEALTMQLSQASTVGFDVVFSTVSG